MMSDTDIFIFQTLWVTFIFVVWMRACERVRACQERYMCVILYIDYVER